MEQAKKGWTIRMPPRFIDRFEIILLDMARTFMFNVDRFSAMDDFAATYRRIGGTALSGRQVRDIMNALFFIISSDYEKPCAMERFSSIRDYLSQLPNSRSLPDSERERLERVFALHEVGEIPQAHAEALHQLRKTHRLGVVSDIWARSDLFLQEFDRAGVRDTFDVIVFSSDHGCVKPSSYLFTKAIEAFNVNREKIVFVGDSWKRDIVGAKAAGLTTIWINANGDAVPNDTPSADLIIRNLRDLL